MSLRDLTAKDEVEVFMSVDDWAFQAAVTPKGETTTFVATFDFGEAPDQIEAGELAAVEGRMSQFLVQRQVIRDGMAAILGTERDLAVGDTITVATTADILAPAELEGAWTVVDCRGTAGGNLTGMARWERLRSAGSTRRDG